MSENFKKVVDDCMIPLHEVAGILRGLVEIFKEDNSLYLSETVSEARDKVKNVIGHFRDKNNEVSRDKSKIEKILEVFDLLVDREEVQDLLDKSDQFELERLYNHKIHDILFKTGGEIFP